MEGFIATHASTKETMAELLDVNTSPEEPRVLPKKVSSHPLFFNGEPWSIEVVLQPKDDLSVNLVYEGTSYWRASIQCTPHMRSFKVYELDSDKLGFELLTGMAWSRFYKSFRTYNLQEVVAKVRNFLYPRSGVDKKLPPSTDDELTQSEWDLV